MQSNLRFDAESISREYFAFTEAYSLSAAKTALARKVESELIKTGDKMKTGRDANRSGSYISECCLTEVTILQGQMLPRCPACCALTIWDFVKQTRGTEAGTDVHVSSRSGK